MTPARWWHWVDGAADAPRADAGSTRAARWTAASSPRSPAATRDDVDAAVRSAAAAQPAWAALAPAERARVLLAIEAALRAERTRSSRSSRPRPASRAPVARDEMLGTADYFGFYAAAARLLGGETFDVGARHARLHAAGALRRRRDDHAVELRASTRRARGAAAALAAGNAVVVKPSEFTSTTTLASPGSPRRGPAAGRAQRRLRHRAGGGRGAASSIRSCAA